MMSVMCSAGCYGYRLSVTTDYLYSNACYLLSRLKSFVHTCIVTLEPCVGKGNKKDHSINKRRVHIKFLTQKILKEHFSFYVNILLTNIDLGLYG